MECEPISFNDVQDESAWQQLLRQCVHRPRGPETGRQRASRGARVWPGVTDLSPSSPSTGHMFVRCQFCGLAAWNGSVHPTRYSSQPRTPFLISTQTVYLKNALSHSLPLQHNDTGIRGLFDPPLHPQTWSWADSGQGAGTLPTCTWVRWWI